jgi:anti-sigma regulatory factor (Ser/Thr protein kinase)
MDELQLTANRRRTGESATLQLSPHSSSARAAREFVRLTLESWDWMDQVETAVLLTSELVTNSIIHAGSDIAVTVRAEGCLNVLVCDESNDEPIWEQGRDPSNDGRGLRLVDALATSWGVSPRERGKAVWFELAS